MERRKEIDQIHQRVAKLVESKSQYKKYIGDISRVLQGPGGQTGHHSNITVQIMYTTLFTPKWIKYYNSKYGRDGPKPPVTSLISDDMLTFIKDTLRLSPTFTAKAKEAIRLQLDI